MSFNELFEINTKPADLKRRIRSPQFSAISCRFNEHMSVAAFLYKFKAAILVLRGGEGHQDQVKSFTNIDAMQLPSNGKGSKRPGRPPKAATVLSSRTNAAYANRTANHRAESATDRGRRGVHSLRRRAYCQRAAHSRSGGCQDAQSGGLCDSRQGAAAQGGHGMVESSKASTTGGVGSNRAAVPPLKFSAEDVVGSKPKNFSGSVSRTAPSPLGSSSVASSVLEQAMKNAAPRARRSASVAMKASACG